MKFAALDHQYFTDRAAFAERQHLDFWFIADNWPLFAGDVNIARFLAIYDLIKQVAHLPGHFCELGCWNGANLLFIAKVLKILQPRELTRVFGFDNFEGVDGKYIGNPLLLEDALRLHDLAETVEVIPGNIEETVPRFIRLEQQDIRFAFIYVDADLFGPTKVAIEHLYPKLLSGGILLFDEYNMKNWAGETAAVHEVLGDGVPLLKVPHTRQPTAYLVKP